MNSSLESFSNINVKKSLIYKSAQIAKGLPEDTNIYIYKGHGIDLCYGGTTITSIVPDNCIYITFSKCGVVTYSKQKKINFIYKSKNDKGNPISSEEKYDMFRRPYIPSNKEKLAKYFEVDINDIHIHYPGTEFVVNHFSPFSMWFSKENVGFGPSGLVSLKLIEDQIQKKENTSWQQLVFKKTSEKVDYLTEVYDKAIKIKNPEFNMNLKKQEFNFQEIENIVTAYFGKKNDILNEIRKEYPLEKENFTRGEANQILFQVYFTKFSNINTIKKLFLASVYPTIQEVETILNTKFKDREVLLPKEIDLLDDEINLFLKNKYASNPKYNPSKYLGYGSNSDFLMKEFPGIHYMMVCRSTTACSENDIMLHRTSSSQAEAVREEIERLISENLIDDETKKYYEFISRVKENVQFIWHQGVFEFFLQRYNFGNYSFELRNKIFKFLEYFIGLKMYPNANMTSNIKKKEKEKLLLNIKEWLGLIEKKPEVATEVQPPPPPPPSLPEKITTEGVTQSELNNFYYNLKNARNFKDFLENNQKFITQMNTYQKNQLQKFFETRKIFNDLIRGLIWNFYRDLKYAVMQDSYIHFLKENQNYIQNMNRKEKNNLMNFFQQRKLYNDEVRDLIWGSSRKYGGTRKSRKTKQRNTRKQHK